LNTIGDYINDGCVDIVPILSLVLNRSKASLISSSDYQLKKSEIIKLNELISKRQAGVPFAYLSENKGFYHLNFKVTNKTLIPRPETELLVDIILEVLDKDNNYDIVDLGTGSGVIAITVADKRPNWQVTGTDISLSALAIAKQNRTTDINFIQGSWFDALGSSKFDLIVSNPPYVAESDPHLEELTFEPVIALTSGEDGLVDIRTIINDAPAHLKDGGYLLLEHGHDQQDSISKLLAKDFHNITRYKDYNGIDRAVLAKLKN
jgi:release factor glutamine methyltransferase